MVSFTLQLLHPQETSTWYPVIGGWVGSKAHLDAVGKRKVFPLSGIEHIFLSRQYNILVTIPVLLVPETPRLI
jgi:hypothetical protein